MKPEMTLASIVAMIETNPAPMAFGGAHAQPSRPLAEEDFHVMVARMRLTAARRMGRMNMPECVDPTAEWTDGRPRV